jgi:hypothetical protein
MQASYAAGRKAVKQGAGAGLEEGRTGGRAAKLDLNGFGEEC